MSDSAESDDVRIASSDSDYFIPHWKKCFGLNSKTISKKNCFNLSSNNSMAKNNKKNFWWKDIREDGSSSKFNNITIKSLTQHKHTHDGNRSLHTDDQSDSKSKRSRESCSSDTDSSIKGEKEEKHSSKGPAKKKAKTFTPQKNYKAKKRKSFLDSTSESSDTSYSEISVNKNKKPALTIPETSSSDSESDDAHRKLKAKKTKPSFSSSNTKQRNFFDNAGDTIFSQVIQNENVERNSSEESDATIIDNTNESLLDVGTPQYQKVFVKVPSIYLNLPGSDEENADSKHSGRNKYVPLPGTSKQESKYRLDDESKEQTSQMKKGKSVSEKNSSDDENSQPFLEPLVRKSPLLEDELPKISRTKKKSRLSLSKRQCGEKGEDKRSSVPRRNNFDNNEKDKSITKKKGISESSSDSDLDTPLKELRNRRNDEAEIHQTSETEFIKDGVKKNEHVSDGNIVKRLYQKKKNSTEHFDLSEDCGNDNRGLIYTRTEDNYDTDDLSDVIPYQGQKKNISQYGETPFSVTDSEIGREIKKEVEDVKVKLTRKWTGDSYTQEDDCILIESDSDDDLFANMSQTTVGLEFGHEADKSSLEHDDTEELQSIFDMSDCEIVADEDDKADLKIKDEEMSDNNDTELYYLEDSIYGQDTDEEDVRYGYDVATQVSPDFVRMNGGDEFVMSPDPYEAPTLDDEELLGFDAETQTDDQNMYVAATQNIKDEDPYDTATQVDSHVPLSIYSTQTQGQVDIKSEDTGALMTTHSRGHRKVKTSMRKERQNLGNDVIDLTDDVKEEVEDSYAVGSNEKTENSSLNSPDEFDHVYTVKGSSPDNMYNCPVCHKDIKYQDLFEVNSHIDLCLNSDLLKDFERTENRVEENQTGTTHPDLKVDVKDHQRSKTSDPGDRLLSVSDVYSIQTQADKKEDESSREADPYLVQTQADIPYRDLSDDSTDDEKYLAQTQLDTTGKTTPEYDPYEAQTLADIDTVGMDDSDGGNFAQTLLDTAHKETFENDMYEAQTLADADKVMVDDTEDEDDVYRVQTQVDIISDHHHSDQQVVYAKPTLLDTTPRSSDEDDDDDDAYLAETQVDQSSKVHSGRKVRCNDELSKIKSQVDSSGNQGTPSPFGKIKAKNIKRPELTEKTLKNLKQLTVKKLPYVISPKKLKTPAEKRAGEGVLKNVSVDKHKFYSSKSLSASNVAKNKKKSEAEKINEIQKTKSTKTFCKPEKRKRRRSSNADSSKTMDSLMIQAKGKLMDRYFKVALHPQPVERKTSKATVSAKDLMDVLPPGEDEIMKLGLPILEYKEKKRHDDDTDQLIQETTSSHAELLPAQAMTKQINEAGHDDRGGEDKESNLKGIDQSKNEKRKEDTSAKKESEKEAQVNNGNVESREHMKKRDISTESVSNTSASPNSSSGKKDSNRSSSKLQSSSSSNKSSSSKGHRSSKSGGSSSHHGKSDRTHDKSSTGHHRSDHTHHKSSISHHRSHHTRHKSSTSHHRSHHTHHKSSTSHHRSHHTHDKSLTSHHRSDHTHDKSSTSHHRSDHTHDKTSRSPHRSHHHNSSSIPHQHSSNNSGSHHNSSGSSKTNRSHHSSSQSSSNDIISGHEKPSSSSHSTHQTSPGNRISDKTLVKDKLHNEEKSDGQESYQCSTSDKSNVFKNQTSDKMSSLPECNNTKESSNQTTNLVLRESSDNIKLEDLEARKKDEITDPCKKSSDVENTNLEVNSARPEECSFTDTNKEFSTVGEDNNKSISGKENSVNENECKETENESFSSKLQNAKVDKVIFSQDTKDDNTGIFQLIEEKENVECAMDIDLPNIDNSVNASQESVVRENRNLKGILKTSNSRNTKKKHVTFKLPERKAAILSRTQKVIKAVQDGVYSENIRRTKIDIPNNTSTSNSLSTSNLNTKLDVMGNPAACQPHNQTSRPNANMLPVQVPNNRPLHEVNSSMGTYSHMVPGTSSNVTLSHQPPPLLKKQSTSDMPVTNELTIDYYLSQLLRWNVKWFEEQAEVKSLPPVFEGKNTLFHIPGIFDTYSDYVKIFTPHLLAETWEIASKSYSLIKERSKPKIKVLFTESTRIGEKMVQLKFSGVMTKKEMENLRSLDVMSDCGLLIMHLWGKHHPPNPKMACKPEHQKPCYSLHLCMLEKVFYFSREADRVKAIKTYPILKGEEAVKSADFVVAQFTMKGRARYFHLLQDRFSFIEPVVTLRSTVRQFMAMAALPRSPLCGHILNPTDVSVFRDLSSQVHNTTQHKHISHYNASQIQAIDMAGKFMKTPSSIPRIMLLQGPPGTGKSHTIIGMIDRMIKENESKGCICMCAPSNAAVDVIARRLLEYKRAMFAKTKDQQYWIRIVRIGNQNTIHKEVKSIGLNELVQWNIKEEAKKNQINAVPKSVRDDLEIKKKRIAVLNDQLNELNLKKNYMQARKVALDIRKEEKQLDDKEKKYFSHVPKTAAQEFEMKRKVLLNADVICGTLNSFGSESIQEILMGRGRGDHKLQKQQFQFKCAIIDEASQAIEMDCLIPLMYGITKLILVGDPQQLPPTVLSQSASEMQFGQSLFERLYNHFKIQSVNPTLMLNIQYRMDTEIASFPCKYVYDDQLQTDRSVMKRHNSLRPYLLYNVIESQETLSQGSGSISNLTEAEFIIRLTAYIVENDFVRPNDIGIIAPYKKQMSLLMEQLRTHKTERLALVEVGTVDGFQGREKGVIILSCVRAKSETGGIGFMASRKRMNVALTRAKNALYIVGHLDSLKEGDQEWRELVNDAQNRKLIVKVANQGQFSHAVQMCKSPKNKTS